MSSTNTTLPDIGFHISTGLTPAQRDGLLDSLIASLPHGADVRACPLDGGERIGVWLRPPVDAAEAADRQRSLPSITLLAAGETFGAFLGADLIRRSAQIAWYRAPQHVDEEGRPRAGGPIHLTGFSLDLAAPDRIVATVSGHDERVRPRLDFNLVTTDTLTANGLLSSASRVRLDGGQRTINSLGGLLQLELPPFGSAWSLHGSVTVAAAGSGDGAAATPGGSVLRLLPAEILLPAGLKLIAGYDRIAVGPNGVTAGGAWSVAERRPAVTIVRPARISAEFPDLSCMAQLRVRATDMRPPLRVSWSAEGMVANPGARSTPILFDVQGARPAQVLPKAVAVRVTDSDGLTAEARTAVQVQVTWAGAPAAAAAPPERVLERPV